MQREKVQITSERFKKLVLAKRLKKPFLNVNGEICSLDSKITIYEIIGKECKFIQTLKKVLKIKRTEKIEKAKVYTAKEIKSEKSKGSRFTPKSRSSRSCNRKWKAKKRSSEMQDRLNFGVDHETRISQEIEFLDRIGKHY